MIGNFKTIGLALIVIFGISAVAVPVASAVEFHSETEDTVLTGSEVTKSVFTSGFGVLKCALDPFETTAKEKTVSKITVGLTTTSCSVFGPAATDLNGCVYVLTFGESGPPYSGPAQIECPAGSEIELTLLTFKCTFKFPAQALGGVVDYENKGSETSRDILVTFTLVEVEYTIGGKCGSGTFKDGEFTTSFTLKGDSKEKQVGVWVE